MLKYLSRPKWILLNIVFICFICAMYMMYVQMNYNIVVQDFAHVLKNNVLTKKIKKYEHYL